jgi:hypothetical protein
LREAHIDLEGKNLTHFHASTFLLWLHSWYLLVNSRYQVYEFRLSTIRSTTGTHASYIID